jgi:hypothetical protein
MGNDLAKAWRQRYSNGNILILNTTSGWHYKRAITFP